MKVSVVIPTYKRSSYLKKCLDSLLEQERPPEEIIVVTVKDDHESLQTLSMYEENREKMIHIKHISIDKPNIVVAENQGIKVATGDIVCFIDDDAVAAKNWVREIVKHYQRDSKTGGVGGPVIPVIQGKPIIEYTNVFSKMTWYGKRITNSRKIPTRLQEVDILGGCNMSFRRDLIDPIDENLLPYWRRFEDDMCLSIKEKGYKILCDPNIKVFHHEASRGLPIDTTPETIIGVHHNSIYVKLKHIKGLKKLICILYESIWGDNTNPGIIPFLYCALKYGDKYKLYECMYAVIGKIKGIWTYIKQIK